jgi:hypothetical protein
MLVDKKKPYLELRLKDEIIEGHPESSVFFAKTGMTLHEIKACLILSLPSPKIPGTPENTWNFSPGSLSEEARISFTGAA